MDFPYPSTSRTRKGGRLGAERAERKKGGGGGGKKRKRRAKWRTKRKKKKRGRNNINNQQHYSKDRCTLNFADTDPTPVSRCLYLCASSCDPHTWPSHHCPHLFSEQQVCPRMGYYSAAETCKLPATAAT